MKIFEKKPRKGGTPAIENKDTSKNFVKVLEKPKALNECRVFISVLTICNNVENNNIRAKL